MEEYVQMTLDDWMEMKRKLQREMIGVKQSFVRIGFALRKIEDGKLYERDGYKSIAEFAKEEYGLEASTVSRFMHINREYSVDGYSEILRPEYEKLGRSQLEEMLKLPESDRAMVQPETSREDIRELKRFNKAEPVAGVADDVDKLVEGFYKDNSDALNEVFAGWEDGEGNAKRVAEIVNPSGSRSYQKGLFFLMMYENKIAVKKFRKEPTDMAWEEFAKRTMDIFGETYGQLAAGGDLWKSYFGNGTDEPETERKEVRVERKASETEHDAQRTKHEEVKTKREEPKAERVEKETRQEEPEGVPGQTTVYDFPELLPKGGVESMETLPKGSAETEGKRDGEETTEGQQDAEEGQEEEIAPAQNEEEKSGVETVGNAYETRKEYMERLTAEEMAAYIVKEREDGHISGIALWREKEMLTWLLQEVDGSGRTIESVEDGNDGEL